MHQRGLFYMTNSTLPPEDRAKAVENLEAAANLDYRRSQYSLGICYKNGIGVPANRVLAWKWLQLAANKGSSKAAEMLEKMRSQMSPSEIAEGQRLAEQFVPRKQNTH